MMKLNSICILIPAKFWQLHKWIVNLSYLYSNGGIVKHYNLWGKQL